jgi:hypothetical protein
LADEGRWTSICVISGSGEIMIGTENEVMRELVSTIALTAGDLTMIPGGLQYVLAANFTDSLHVSIHSISPQLAFYNSDVGHE